MLRLALGSGERGCVLGPPSWRCQVIGHVGTLALGPAPHHCLWELPSSPQSCSGVLPSQTTPPPAA